MKKFIYPERPIGEFAKAVFNGERWVLTFGWHIGSLNHSGIVIYKDDLMEKHPTSIGDDHVEDKKGAVQLIPYSEAVDLVNKNQMSLKRGEKLPKFHVFLNKRTGTIMELLYVDEYHGMAGFRTDNVVITFHAKKGKSILNAILDEVDELGEL